jgi:hypothetical protein
MMSAGRVLEGGRGQQNFHEAKDYKISRTGQNQYPKNSVTGLHYYMKKRTQTSTRFGKRSGSEWFRPAVCAQKQGQ